MSSLTLHGQIREIRVRVEEGGARDMTGEVELPSLVRISQLPAAVDELVAHGDDCDGGALGGVSRA
jgi:hypothetical protein